MEHVNKRIVFFQTVMNVGGAQRQSIELAEKLIARGWDCRFLAFYDEYSPQLVSDTVLARTTFMSGRRLRDVRAWKRCWAYIKAFDPLLVVGVNEAPLRLSVWGRLCGQHSAMTVCTFHSTIIAAPERRRRFPLFRWTLPFANGLVYVSERQRDYWKERRLMSRRDIVIHNGIDVSAFSVPDQVQRSAARQKFGFAPDDIVYGLVATFRPEKNHGQMVEAIAALRARGVPAKALFVGDGGTRAEVEAQAVGLGVVEHVIFAGEHGDVRPLVAAVDVGVLTSVAIETFSIAALEMMAMGIPMVMSDIGGASEIVSEGKTGFLFPAADTEVLVDKLSRFTDREARSQMGAEARLSVARQFTSDIMADRYAAFFGDLAGHVAGSGAVNAMRVT